MDAETEHMKKKMQRGGGGVHVVMVPAPLQGHLTPFVHLALKLASHGFTVTFLNTHATHSKLVRSAAGDCSSDIFSDARDSSGMDIRYALIGDGFPLGFDRAINHDTFVQGLIYVFSAHVDDFIGQNHDVDPPVSCLLADSFFVWPSAVARKHGLVNVSFWTQPALALTMYFHRELLRAHGHLGPQENGDDEDIDYIPGVESIKPRDIPSQLQDPEPLTLVNTYVFESLEDAAKADIIVSNTVFELEPSAITALQRKMQFYPIGPVLRNSVIPKFTLPTSFRQESTGCRPWLDARPEDSSVLYVSFGSLANVDKSVIHEIARGLALSGASFLWAIRGDITGSSADEPDLFPAGFDREVGGRALVVPWCDQTEVLSHRATGGFMTHCGWNSVLESVWCGVPMLCFPLLTDQPTNRKLVVEDWKVGIDLCDGRSVRGGEVGEKIKRLMSREEREGMRKNMKLAKETLQRAVSPNGSSEKHLETFIHEVKLKTQQKHSFTEM